MAHAKQSPIFRPHIYPFAHVSLASCLAPLTSLTSSLTDRLSPDSLLSDALSASVRAALRKAAAGAPQHPVFSLDDVRAIVQCAVAEREAAVRVEFDQQLNYLLRGTEAVSQRTNGPHW
jgi:hypothetical protein